MTCKAQGALDRIADAQAAETRHNCQQWREEGFGCAECNPLAIESRESWKRDPIRAERDRLRADIERLQRLATEMRRGVLCAGVHHDRKDYHDGLDCPVLARYDAELAAFTATRSPTP